MAKQLVDVYRDQSSSGEPVLDCNTSSYHATGRHARACEDASSLLPGNASAAFRNGSGRGGRG